MTKTGKIMEFMNSFGIPAYPVGAIPDEKHLTYPYIAFENSVGNALDAPVYIAARVWFYTSSEKSINDKVEEIAETIGRGGRLLSYDGGAVWIKRGTPWSNPVQDENPAIKGRQLNLTLEFV